MAVTCNKRNSKYLVLFTLGAIFVYIPLNILYLVTIGRTTRDSKDTIVQKPVQEQPKSYGQVGAIEVKQLVPHADGKVDVVLSMDMKNLVKTIDATAVGSFSGEFTSNPLPINTTFVKNNSMACQGIPDLQYIIYMHSAPNNVERRNIMRSTWASKNLFKKQISKLVFMMGTPNNTSAQQIIDKEHELYGDIVQGSFKEDYKNLTLKGIMGLKWVSQFCPQAPYAIKADDDAFINLFRLMEVIEKHKKKNRAVICPLWKDSTMPILRDPASCMKWCVKYNEFPGRSHFPRYCAGLSFVLSRDIIRELYEASFSTPFFWVDDVYVTGMLTSKVKNFEFVDLLSTFTLKEAVALEEYTGKGAVTHIFSHVKKRNNFYSMWNATLNRLTKSEIETLGDEVLKEYPYLKNKLDVKAR